MKKNTLAIIALLISISSITHAQWVTSSPGIYYNSGTVGIGTTPNSRQLSVYTAGTDVNSEFIISRTTGANYALIANANGVGAGLNQGLFATASGASSNYGLRIWNVLGGTDNYAIYSDSPAKSYFMGNVGIGTTTPSTKLAVVGDFGTTGGQGLLINNTNASGYSEVVFTNNTYRADGDLVFGLGATGSANSDQGYFWNRNNAAVLFGTYNTERIRITGGGYVGIGTSNPDQLLSVKGTIHAQEVKIDMTGWSDYVFKPTYKLPALAAVKAYIDQNHHLPEIPSEEEMVKNGLNVSEMNKLLMKKVEELTLYLIEENKQKREQQKEIDLLKTEVKALKNKN